MNRHQQSPPERWEYLEDQPRIDGVVIGVVVRVEDSGQLFVNYPSNPLRDPLPAHGIPHVTSDDVGREVALVFVEGNPAIPFVIGFLQHPRRKGDLLENVILQHDKALDIQVDGQTLTLSANRQIVIRCGEASITLTRAGKVLIRGTYIASRSRGVNKVKGASLELN
jgi:hypothetical protein